jgi:hypothetical protein
MRKIIFISLIFIIAIFSFSCAGGMVDAEMFVGTYTSNSNGSYTFNADNSMELIRANGNMGATGNWENNPESLGINYFTLYDIDGENEYEEVVNYDYFTAYVDGMYFAPISSVNMGEALEGTTWELGMIKRYDQSTNVEGFLGLELDMSFTFVEGELTITYNVYKEYNDTGTLIYDAVESGETTEVIPYTMEEGKIMLDYPPLPNYIFAGSRLGDPSVIDYMITEEGKLLLYYYEKG